MFTISCRSNWPSYQLNFFRHQQKRCLRPMEESETGRSDRRKPRCWHRRQHASSALVVGCMCSYLKKFYQITNMHFIEIQLTCFERNNPSGVCLNYKLPNWRTRNLNIMIFTELPRNENNFTRKECGDHKVLLDHCYRSASIFEEKEKKQLFPNSWLRFNV